MRLALLFLLLTSTAAHASPWRALARVKAEPVPAHTLQAEAIDQLSALPNAPSAIASVAVVRRTRAGLTALVYGLAPAPPSAGAIDPTLQATHPRGHAALVRVPKRGKLRVLDAVEVPPPVQTELRLAAAAHLDGDRRKDAVYSWTKSLNRVRRTGALIARGDTLSNVSLGSDARPRAAIDVTVACFAPVAGSDARALLIGRRAVGRSRRAGVLDSIEALLPGPDGRYVARQLFGAAFAEQSGRSSAQKAWITAFRPRPRRLTAQTELGRCPGEGVVVPARALRPEAAADAYSVLGPFALSSTTVRARLDRIRKRLPRAVVVLGVGG